MISGAEWSKMDMRRIRRQTPDDNRKQQEIRPKAMQANKHSALITSAFRKNTFPVMHI